MEGVNTFSFLKGGGEMGERTRNFDWSQTPVGSPGEWPQSLRSIVSVILNSKFPMFLWWGDDLIQFYNDAYRPSLGDNGKHPLALGQRGEECWPEIWPIIKPLIDQVLSGGDPTWSEDQLIPIYRNGRLEDVYWTFGYSPVKDEAGHVNGVLVICNETTEKVAGYQKVEENKQQLEFAIEATELATWDINPITKKFTANARYEEWFGVAAQSPDSNPAFQVIADEDRQMVIDAYEKAINSSTKADYDIEYKIRPKGRPERTLRAKGKAWFNGGEIAYRFTGTLQDVTAQVNTRRKIEESENRFRSLIQEAPVATSLLVGRELKIELANEAVLNMWGKGSSIIGKTLQEALPELKGQHFLKTLDDVFTSGTGFTVHADPTVLVVDGKEQEFYFDFTNKPIFDEEGKVWAILSMGVDVTEQVLSVKKLEESEQQVLSFVESAPFPIGVYVGKEMRIQLANQTMLDTWGKGNNVIGKLYSDVLPELDNQHIFEQLESVYSTGKPFHAKNQRVDLFIAGKLQPYYFNYSFTPLFNKSGEVYGVMNTAANVTELNIAHQRVNESENNLRNVILQAPVAMCILKGEDFVVEIANDRMLELWGKTTADMIAKPLFEGLHEVKGQGFEELLDSVYHRGETVRALATPVMLPRKAGAEMVYVDFVYEAFRNAVTDEISGVMVVAVDVTDQVIARKKIEESEERARLAVESAELGTYEVNLLDNHLVSSTRLDQIFNIQGASERERYVSAIHPDDLKIREAAYEVGLKTGILEYIGRVIWKDGSTHWIRVKGRILLDESKRPARLLGVVQDITEQKLFEAELNRQVKERTVELENKNQQLENINQELEQFTYAASHDMQEPLRKVNTFTSFLLENHSDQLDARGKNYLERIGASVLRMKNIIDDLLNYSYQTREEQQLMPTDLNRIIRDIEADLEVIIDQKNATIVKDDFPTIVAVPTQVNQLISNLVSNALKFTKPGLPVKIEIKSKTLVGSEVMRTDVDPQQKYLKMSVIDNGIGFEQQYAEQVFGLFKRLHGKSDFAGTGIGLGLCKKIVQNHQGTIWAESESGKGAAFHVLLPITQ